MASGEDIQETNRQLAQQHTHITALTEAYHKYSTMLDKISDSHQKLQEAVYKGEGGFTAMISSMAEMGAATDKMLATMGSFVGILPGLGDKAGAALTNFNALGEAFKVASDKLAIFGEQITYFDTFSSAIRQSEADMRGFAGAFGGGVEEARKLSAAMIGPGGIREALASEDFGYIGGEQIEKFRGAMAAANLSTEYMTDTVRVADHRRR